MNKHTCTYRLTHVYGVHVNVNALVFQSCGHCEKKQAGPLTHMPMHMRMYLHTRMHAHIIGISVQIQMQMHRTSMRALQVYV